MTHLSTDHPAAAVLEGAKAGFKAACIAFVASSIPTVRLLCTFLLSPFSFLVVHQLQKRAHVVIALTIMRFCFCVGLYG